MTLPPGKRTDAVLPAGPAHQCTRICARSRSGPRHSYSTGSLQHPRSHLEGQPIPTGGLLEGERWALRAQPSPGPKTTALAGWGLCGAARTSFALVELVWPPKRQNNPAISPSTLLISLCLSLLTISSSTSPSPLISLEDKHRTTRREDYLPAMLVPPAPCNMCQENKIEQNAPATYGTDTLRTRSWAGASPVTAPTPEALSGATLS